MATAGLEWRWPVLFSSTSSTPHTGADGAGVRSPGRAIRRRARHSQRGRAELRLRRRHACSSATSSRATTAWKAARAPMSACAIPASTATAGPPTRSSANPTRWPAQNSFAAPDLVNVGAFSGLETPTSDYVGLFGFARRSACRLRSAPGSTSRRFELRRAELKAGLVGVADFADREIRLHPGAAALRFLRRPPRGDARRHRPTARDTGACSRRAHMISSPAC